MKMLFKRKIISVILVVSMIFAVFAVSVSATDVNSSTYAIEVDGTLFTVTVTLNTDGTKLITVVGNGEVVSWSSANLTQETVEPLDTRETGFYDSYRYIYK